MTIMKRKKGCEMSHDENVKMLAIQMSAMCKGQNYRTVMDAACRLISFSIIETSDSEQDVLKRLREITEDIGSCVLADEKFNTRH